MHPSRSHLLVLAVVALAVIGAAAPGSGLYLPVIQRMPTPTATATATSTATATQVATATSTATPTLQPTATRTTVPSQGVSILSNGSHYVSSGGYLHILGEVHNNTGSHLEYVRISVNLYSASGQLLDTDYTYTMLDVVAPGDRACFDLLVLDPPAGWSYYEFEAPTYHTGADPVPALALLNHSGSYKPTWGWYEIIGQVRNDSGVRVEYVQAVGTLYNSGGTLIGCDFTYVNSTHLEPGQTSAFEMLAIGRDYSDVASYRLQADGNAQ